MKLSLAVTLLLSSLSFAQEPTAPSPTAAPTPAAPQVQTPTQAAVPSQSRPVQHGPSKALPTQFPSVPAKLPVRAQPFGELLTPDSQTPASKTLTPQKPTSQAPGFEKRINSLRSGVPAKLPRGTVSREIDMNKLPAKRPTTPPELVAAAMQNDDANNGLSGRSMTLIEALSYANTPQRQLEVIHAYWHLVSSVARYNLECRLVQRLEGLRSSASDGATLQTALASADAAREDARCASLTAQHALAEAAMLGVGDSLPLPIDLPHVGSYRTRFAEIFSTKPAPPRLVLIDRTLPIHCKSIDARTRAIAAADDSLQAAMSDHAAGQGGLEGVIACVAQLNRQHVTLVEAVCNYNHAIAEYAVTSLGQPISGSALVSMLIKTKHDTTTHFDPRTQPASAISPSSNGPQGYRPSDNRPSDNRPSLSHPTLAPPRLQDPESGEPETEMPATRINPTRPPKRLDPAAQEPATVGPAIHNGLLLDAPGMPRKAPPRLNTPSRPTNQIENLEPPRPDTPKQPGAEAVQTRPIVPVQATTQPMQTPQSNERWTSPVVRTTNKPDTDSRGSNILRRKGAATSTGLYPGLTSASAAERAKHLVQTLHSNVRGNADHNLAADTGRPIELADYLDLGQGINRRALVEAFWFSRQRTAELRVLTQQSQLLDEIQVPYSVRLQAAQLTTKADMIDAHIRLLEAQFQLTSLVGKTAETLWLTAAGVPRSTAYNVATIANGSDTWEFRRRRAMIPALHQTLCRRAVAVVEADAARVQANVAPHRAGVEMLDIALGCTFRQTEETLALLASATDYNNAVASHLLHVLPPAVSNRVLAEKLLAGS